MDLACSGSLMLSYSALSSSTSLSFTFLHVKVTLFSFVLVQCCNMTPVQFPLVRLNVVVIVVVDTFVSVLLLCCINPLSCRVPYRWARCQSVGRLFLPL